MKLNDDGKIVVAGETRTMEVRDMVEHIMPKLKVKAVAEVETPNACGAKYCKDIRLMQDIEMDHLRKEIKDLTLERNKLLAYAGNIKAAIGALGTHAALTFSNLYPEPEPEPKEEAPEEKVTEPEPLPQPE